MEHIKTTVINLRNGRSQRICLPFEEVQKEWARARRAGWMEATTMKFPTGVERDVLNYEVITDAIISMEVGIDIQVIPKSNPKDLKENCAPIKELTG